jgi:hypothetical protein
MTTPDPTDHPLPVRRGRRALRLTVITIAVLAALLLAASTALSGR